MTYSLYTRDEFISDILIEIRDKKLVFKDKDNKIIDEKDLIETLNGIYMRKNKKYMEDLPCKATQLIPHIPIKWKNYIS